MAVSIDISVLLQAERGALELERVLDPTEQYAISVVSALSFSMVCTAPPDGELMLGRRTSRDCSQRSQRCQSTFSLRARIREHRQRFLLAGTPVDANDLWIGATAIQWLRRTCFAR
jgi:predicted nucleic acid-binding protein